MGEIANNLAKQFAAGCYLLNRNLADRHFGIAGNVVHLPHALKCRPDLDIFFFVVLKSKPFEQFMVATVKPFMLERPLFTAEHAHVGGTPAHMKKQPCIGVSCELYHPNNIRPLFQQGMHHGRPIRVTVPYRCISHADVSNKAGKFNEVRALRPRTLLWKIFGARSFVSQVSHDFRIGIQRFYKPGKPMVCAVSPGCHIKNVTEGIMDFI